MWHHCSMQQSSAGVVCSPNQLETVNRGAYLHLADNGGWDHKHNITEPWKQIVLKRLTLDDTYLIWLTQDVWSQTYFAWLQIHFTASMDRRNDYISQQLFQYIVDVNLSIHKLKHCNFILYWRRYFSLQAHNHMYTFYYSYYHND